jgi:serine/threonine protein kinase
MRFARFRVVRELGRGAQGTVHEAVDVERESRVALKTLRRLGGRVRLGELVEQSGSWLFTMELVDGVDFITYVRGERSLEQTRRGRRAWTGEAGRRARSASPGSATRGGRAVDADPCELRHDASFDEGRLRRALGQLAVALAFLHALPLAASHRPARRRMPTPASPRSRSGTQGR